MKSFNKSKFSVFLVCLLLPLLSPIQAAAKEEVHCTFDRSKLSQNNLIPVDCGSMFAYSGLFSFEGKEYVSTAGYLVTSGTYDDWTIGKDGALDKTWNREKFRKSYPILGERDRTKLKEYDPDSQLFQAITEIETETGIQINYGKDSDLKKLSIPLTDESKCWMLAQGIQRFAAQFPKDFFKDVMPGISITLTECAADEVGLSTNVLANAIMNTSKEPVQTRFNIECTALNSDEFEVMQSLNHELGHCLDSMIGVVRSQSSFTEVIDRLSKEPKRSDYYVTEHSVTRIVSKTDFQYPDSYSQKNDCEYIGRLFEYALTPGYEFLFKEGTFYRHQAELALDQLIRFDPAFAQLPVNFK